MTRWFTSDLHFSHARIIELAYREFNSVEEMNEEIIKRYNAIVKPDDEVYFLGDCCMGQLVNSLPLLGLLNGRKYLILGNHDRPSKLYHHKSEERRQEWFVKYSEYFISIHEELIIEINNEQVLLTHLPYDNPNYVDHSYEGRYKEFQPINKGLFHLHGHQHSKVAVKGNEIDVGVDGHFFTPWSEEEIIAVMNNR